MSVAQPTHLLIFNETTGLSITNYGTDGTAYSINAAADDPEDYTWVPQAVTPTGGYLDAITKTHSTDMPHISTAATAFADTLTTVNFAVGFTVDSRETVVGQKIVSEATNNGVRVHITAPTSTGNFDIVARMYTTGGGGYEATFADRTFGTFYQLAGSLNVGTPSSSIIKFKLNAGAVDTSAAQNLAGQVLHTAHPRLNRDPDFTTYGANDGRYYYFAYERGGTVWGDTDLGDINSDPAATITGWPGGGGDPDPVLGRRIYVMP